MGSPELAPFTEPDPKSERHLSEVQLDELERSVKELPTDSNPVLLHPANETAPLAADADQIFKNGNELIADAENKVLDNDARSRGLQRYQAALATLKHLDPDSAAVKRVMLDISWARHARQDETTALLWALDKSGLVVNNTEATAS